MRASDIGSWTFCQRSWWLANIQDVPHQNPKQLDYGNRVHDQHGRNVTLSKWAELTGLLLIVAAMFIGAILIVWLTFF